MIEIKTKIFFLVACLAEVGFLMLSQIVNSEVAIILCLIMFLFLVFSAAMQGFAIPVLMFFLPFATIIKIRPNTITLYTIALLIVYVVYLVKHANEVRIYHYIPGLLLIAHLLIVRTVSGIAITNSFLLFSVSLFLVPYVACEIGKHYDFYWMTLFFSLGIIVSAISAKYLLLFPTIARYITVHSMSGTVRYSGFYNDPNYYSAHITSAIAGLIILLLKNNNGKKRLFVEIILLGFLGYCGLLSVSKTFLLIAFALVLVWVLVLMFQKGKVTFKLSMILALIIGGGYLLSFTVFSDLINQVLDRITSSTSLGSLTTHRTEIWMEYINALDKDVLLLFFGRGFERIYVNGRASHNTLIQCVYQFGLIGSMSFVAWTVCYFKTLLGNSRLRNNKIFQVFILMLGSFGPWLALDMLFFDEIFLLPIYVCAGIRSFSENVS